MTKWFLSRSKMSLRLISVVYLASFALCEEITKKTDSNVSGTDFVPTFQTFQFPPQSVFGPPNDLTALQQTHVLGSFHHRFHPTRVNTQFGPNPPPLVFTPQTHILPPQPAPTIVQDQLRQSLIPPQQLPSHHEVLHPPNPQPQDSQQSILVPPQPPQGTQQTFRTSSSLKPFSSPHDQSIKNAFPSNAPHTIKFSISSQNYNPNQGKQAGNPVNGQNAQVKANQHLTSGLQQSNFVSQHQQLSRPINNQPAANLNVRQQQSNFNDLSKVQHNNFQNFNLKKPEVLVNQQNVNFNIQPASSFGPTSGPINADLSSQFRGNVAQTQSNPNLRHQQTNEIPANSHLSTPGQNFQIHPTDSQSQNKFSQQSFSQSSFEFRQNDLNQQVKFNQQPFVQQNFQFPQIHQQQTNLNVLQPTPQSQSQSQSQSRFQFPSTNQQNQFANFPSANYNQNFEFRSTQSPLINPTESQPLGGDKDVFFQKSQEPNLHGLAGNSFNSQNLNEVSLRPSSTTTESVVTQSTKYRKPKPIVKEITINLNDKKISGESISPQLYIKEDRQREFQEIKEQDQRKGKNEKSQEDVINEQIQKLLQSHNLEIIDKDNDSQTESQEAQLAQFSEQFKKKYNYSVQLLNGGSLLGDIKSKKKVLTTLPPLPELPDHIKKQYDIKLVHRDELFKQFDLPDNHKLANDSSNVFLANGQNLEIVKFSKNGIMNKIPVGTKALDGSPTTAKPPKVLFEELAKGVIPPGADFELIKHKEDGQVEKVSDLNTDKKVTFVFLEEQPDGTVKVQGVKGNSNQETGESENVHSLIKKIKDGSLKLPPSKRTEVKSLLTNEIPRISPSTDKTYVTFPPSIATPPTPRSIHGFPSTIPPFYADKDSTEEGPTTEFPFSSPYAIDIEATYTPTPFYETTPESPTTFLPTVNYIRSSTRRSKSRSRITFLPTVPTVDATFTPTFASRRLKPTTSSVLYHKSVGTPRKSHKTTHSKTSSSRYEESESRDSEILSHRSTEYKGQRLRVPQDVIAEESNIDSVRPINEILKENGLNEMAKFLDQSGLDSILNETGPYTIFIPTNKAFKTLEAQLGGADKAEDKFRENPRLLSGLLLHHVVPGSFRLEDLQDEMTGVSLAGTQLRVNTYSTDDKESSQERIVTINGAKISNDKKDITVPQGLAHAIDRVLFPLPVGDILQTLRGDRERRFTKFLKSLESSGLSDMLTGTKTYTVFAPTDKAFSVLTDAELDKLLTRREAAKTIVLRHIVPGTLYSAGMNYYQVKDSMETGQKIVIKKELGKIKANSAQIISANIPATNGVIHAVETLL